ncbi:MAG: ABC transporter permease [Oscillospiraceae bacterium]|nr:ABC transporter permease [Oscillospiraceae bacterium]
MKANSSFRQFSVVLNHEYKNLIKSKFFRGITLVFLLGIILLLTLPPMLQKSMSAPQTAKQSLLVVDETGQFAQADFSSLNGYNIIFGQVNQSFDQLKRLIVDGEYDDVVIISRDSQGKISLNFLSKRVLDSLPQNLQTLIAAANIKNIMVQNNVPDTAIAQALTSPDLSITETSGSMTNGFLPTYIMIMVLFYSMIVYGAMVASGVAQEKSSRAMELLITSAKTQNLILGKIIGIGLAGLTQLAIWLLGMLIFFQINFSYWKDNAIVSGLFGMPASKIAIMLLFYLMGFFMYAALYGAIGSLVSRMEDIQMLQLPIVFLLMIGLFVTIFGMIQPGSTMLIVFSFIPIYTPMSMFARINTSDVVWWQVALSMVLSFATVVLFAWAAAKIYRVGVLMYGKLPSLKEIIRAIRDDKNV